MQAKVFSASIDGMEAKEVVVEVATASGLPKVEIIGLGDQAIREAAARVRSALDFCDFDFPYGRITINLAPAWLRKRGSHFDLAIAIGIMLCTNQIFEDSLDEYGFIGELALDGKLSRCKGVLQMVRALRDKGLSKVIVPIMNLEEAALVKGVTIYGAGNLKDIIDFFNLKESGLVIQKAGGERIGVGGQSKKEMDYSEIKGQEPAKRALMIAAAGGHGVIMKGSPGTGKTMLAERLPGVLPSLTDDEVLDITAVYSVAGLLDENTPIVTERPFRCPGMSLSIPALLGSGTPPRPGEISLAHKGVLFLDELGERNRDLIDSLRMPMESKSVIIQRMGVTYRYPSDFLFVAASNLCKCGGFGDPRKECTCTPSEIHAYRSKLSGPMAGRIDIHIELMSPEYTRFTQDDGMSTKEIKEIVCKGREIQKKRYGSSEVLNGNIDGKDLDRVCVLSKDAEDFMGRAYDRYSMDPRSLTKVKRISRTIADIANKDIIQLEHVAEALQYREKKYDR